MTYPSTRSLIDAQKAITPPTGFNNSPDVIGNKPAGNPNLPGRIIAEEYP